MKLINLKRYLNNQLVNKSIKVLFLRILGVSLFFSITLFITNYFDPELVGKYDFSRSLLLFFGGISVFGMHQSVIYYSGFLTSKNAINDLKKIYSKMIVIVLLMSILIFVIFFAISDKTINLFFEKDVASLTTKTTITLFFYGITILNIDVFRAIDKIYISELYRNVIRYAPFSVLVLLIFFTNNNNLLVDAFLINFLFLGIFSTIVIFMYFSKIENNKTNFNISYRSIVKRSGPMAISGIAYILMQSVDVLLLGKFADFKTVAFYSAAIKLTTIISLVLTSVNAVFAPKIAELFSKKDFVNLNLSLQKATRLIFILTIPGIILLAVFSSLFLSFFGEGYIQAKSALMVLLIGQAVNALCGSVGVYMNMTGKQNIFQFILIIAFLLNLLLNWILIPRYSMLGAAIATSFSMIFWNLLGTIYLLKKDRTKTFLN